MTYTCTYINIHKTLSILKGQKDSTKEKKEQLPAMKWATVYRALRPFLRPFGDSGEGRLDFYHRMLSKVVRKKYVSIKQMYPFIIAHVHKSAYTALIV